MNTSCAKELAWLLQEEILARVLGLLQPCQLHWVERVNTRLRNTGKQLGCDGACCLSYTPQVGAVDIAYSDLYACYSCAQQSLESTLH